MDAGVVLDFFSAAIRIATPLLLAALGGILSERAGTFAVGLEGQMLCGAFAGVVATHFAGSLGLGLVAAASAGAAFGVIIAVATVRFQTEQMVSGLAANILALGLTSFLLRSFVGGGQAPVIRVATLQPWPIPGLADLPFAGPLLFQQPPLTYLAFVLLVAVQVLLFKTRAGLTLRAVGENPQAAYAAGAEPARVRMTAVIAGAALAGLAGAVLSLQQVGTFTDGMTHGRGYLALAAIIVGRWMPLGTLCGCLLFGAAEALQLRVQTFSVPVSSYVVQMTPYVLALAVLAALGRSARLPAAIGQPFRRT
jgi:simple sugar transport system permease protein